MQGKRILLISGLKERKYPQLKEIKSWKEFCEAAEKIVPENIYFQIYRDIIAHSLKEIKTGNYISAEDALKCKTKAGFESERNVRVIEKIKAAMTPDQFDAWKKTENIDWLHYNFPDWKQIVREEVLKLIKEGKVEYPNQWKSGCN